MSSQEQAQVTDRVMMVRPSLFASNQDTLADNAFQQSAPHEGGQSMVHATALAEFDAFSDVLKREGVQVNIVQDTLRLPDAIFPNNWISFHQGPTNGGEAKKPTVILYPMMSIARRQERRADIVQQWRQTLGAELKDYRTHEEAGQFLEGTGSMVLDRVNRIVYACLSQRTNETLLRRFCDDFSHELVAFRAFSDTRDSSRAPIYHTNVMMSVGTTFALVCTESIADAAERRLVCDALAKSGKTVIPISVEQMLNFAGNVLQLRSGNGRMMLAMSTRAYRSLSEEQLEALSQHSCVPVHSGLETIETYGGGGARCMIAEVFPPLNSRNT